MPTIAFLGAGNMAAAMVDGLRAGQGGFSLVCHSASGRTAEALARRTGIRSAPSLEDLLSGADALVVAF